MVLAALDLTDFETIAAGWQSSLGDFFARTI
jgi:hypothetical protein